MKSQTHNNHSPLLADMVYGVKHGLFEDDLGRSLHQVWSLGVSDELIDGMIKARVRSCQVQEAFGHVPPFQKSHLDNGEVVWGKGLWNEVIRQPAQDLCSGMGVFSGTGGGKSNLLSFIAPQIAARGANVWLAEMYKTQLRQLRPVFQRLGKDLVVLRADGWKYNPLYAECRDPHVHLLMVVDLLDRILDLPLRARSILLQGCHELYRKFGVWDGKSKTFPCLFDLFEWVRSTPGLNPQSRDAILDRLGALLASRAGRCMAYRVGWNPVDLQRFSVIFEMRDVSEQIKQLLLETCLYSIFQYEYQRGVVNAPLSLFIAFEDSQRFLSSNQQTKGEITPIAELAAVERGSGKALCILGQTTHGISRPLMANLTTKIMGRLGTHEDYQTLGADMGMDAAQIVWAMKNLKAGTFIGQTSIGNWREPFVFRVPHLNIPVTVDDQAAAESLKALDGLPTERASEFDHWEMRPIVEVREVPASGVPPLSEVELRYLKSVVQNPGKPSGLYARLVGISGKRAVEIRTQFVASGYLREHKAATGKRGRHSIFLEPLPPALEAVAKLNGGGLP